VKTSWRALTDAKKQNPGVDPPGFFSGFSENAFGLHFAPVTEPYLYPPGITDGYE
jgi:hypothetical protein